MQALPSITNQSMIGWGHIIRGRISKAFFPQIKQYYYQNKLGKIFRPQFWFKRLTTFTLTLHDEEWTQHCAKIHQPTKDKKLSQNRHS